MNAQEFRQQVFAVFLQDMHQLQSNNYDAQRFSADGVDRSQLFDVGKHAMFLDWFSSNYEGVFAAWSTLADQASRDLYIDILRFKLAGHLHVRINSRVPGRAAELARFRDTFIGQPSKLATSGMFGKLVHYDCEWNGRRYTIDLVNGALACELVNRQYYFERDGIAIQPDSGDYVIDAGAFTGDSTVLFAGSVGPAGHVYAFDPVKNHQEIISYNVAQGGFDNVTLYPYGVGEASVEAPPIELNTYNPGYRASADPSPVPLRSLDDLVARGEIPKVDLIKMDVEGSEMGALRGARQTIERFRPKLAISIYHKPNDFFEIVNYLASLQLGYVFYLDHHTIYEEETVVYASVA